MTTRNDAIAELEQTKAKQWTRLKLKANADDKDEDVPRTNVRVWASGEGEAIHIDIGGWPTRFSLQIEPQAAYDLAQALLDSRLEANRVAELMAIINAPEPETPADVYPMKMDPSDAATAAALAADMFDPDTLIEYDDYDDPKNDNARDETAALAAEDRERRAAERDDPRRDADGR